MPRGPVQRLPSPAGGGECTSGCCRRAAENCQSYSSLKGSEGGTCHTECQQGLTHIFPKNEKSFTIIYGHCKKTEKKKSQLRKFLLMIFLPCLPPLLLHLLLCLPRTVCSCPWSPEPPPTGEEQGGRGDAQSLQ
ncbi:LOW QUALITY PROTEIN: colipase-like protein 1 [Neophocaena asiaeorientalis asiaeorientalis]|uniref:LOW QUALITY PROTEIN: colipase-like protein 1 n=1 Tax=Neophocaena asiaeorientalis asiaeorientalis TaxID=1706337 RepID=A0A341D750_NEOAA|nr:LOW QUALITY PROTEIN: colipase-like protein 1 [Neophocaena asiaeorientalis asiaeorientalis]